MGHPLLYRLGTDPFDEKRGRGESVWVHSLEHIKVIGAGGVEGSWNPMYDDSEDWGSQGELRGEEG